MSKPGYNVYCPECDTIMKKSEDGRLYECPFCHETVSARDAALARDFNDLPEQHESDDWKDWF